MSVKQVLRAVGKYKVNLVEVTGGEPLLQPDTAVLCKELLDAGHTVMVETNGSLDISTLPGGVRRIIDIKCPGSGMAGSFLMDNLKRLNGSDELKFVLASIDDAEWAGKFCIDHDEVKNCGVIFSPVSNSLPYNVLADWMIENKLSDVRMGIQLHKIIWDDIRGK
jgi:7-carboxy-7-deazaguanine synthase